MRKKLYLQSFFLVNFNHKYAHSFGVRLLCSGANILILGYGAVNIFFKSLRLKALPDEKFK